MYQSPNAPTHEDDVDDLYQRYEIEFEEAANDLSSSASSANRTSVVTEDER